jgi:hypothetical protein
MEKEVVLPRGWDQGEESLQQFAPGEVDGPGTVGPRVLET